MKLSHFKELLKKWDVEYEEGVALSSLSSIGIGGQGVLLVTPSNETDFIRCIDYLVDNEFKFKIVGRMTNILFSDDGYDGVLLHTRKIQGYTVAEKEIRIDAGALFSRALKDLAGKGLGGLESLYGIPGSVGGMIYNNAGAYGKQVSDFLINARVYDAQSHSVLNLNKDDLALSYRHSVLKEKDYYLLDATFNLERLDPDLIRQRMKEVTMRRKCSQPYDKRSLGSIFKRCGDIPISALIDRAGLRGCSVGGASVSTKHAGFIVNNGGASSKDVVSLIRIIKSTLAERFSIIPEEEIEILT